MSFKHRESCTKAFEKYNADVQKYEQKYPKYCKKCEGWGGKWTKFDPSPPGVALAPGYMWDFDPCPDCVDQGICPRCQKTLDMDMREEFFICHDCGWTDEDNGEDYGIPPYPQCHCEFLDGSNIDELYG